MTYELNVDYMILRKKIKQLSELYMKLNDEVGKIAEYTGNLDIFWDGDANNAYITKTGEDLACISALMMRIRGVIKAADGVFGLYMSNEQKIRTIISEYGR